jgi:hypothetical protein
MGLSQVDSALRRGLGRIKPIASTYKVYRLGGLSGTANAATSIIDPLNLVNESFPARITLGLPKSTLENEPIYKMLYGGICDVRSLKIGDVLVETGPTLAGSPDGRAYVLSDVQPLMPAVFARTEIMGSLTRPNGPSQTDDPVLGLGVYQGQSKKDEWLYVLDNGMYDVAGTGTAAVIPMGLQPYSRLGPAQELKFPTATHRSTHFAYIPLLPGVQIMPGDMVSDQNGNRFKIETVSAFTSGLQGYQAICESVFI